MLVSEVIDIRHGCQFISSLIRALVKLPGGLGRFLPCGVGSHMSRLRHLGWNQCSHGLTSRPLASCHHQCLGAVCGVLGYNKGAASERLDGTLKLRYCTTIFLLLYPHGYYLGLAMGMVRGYPFLLFISWILDDGKRVRLTRKTRPGVSSHSIPDPGHPTPKRWKRLLSPSSRGEGGEVGMPRNLFSTPWGCVRCLHLGTPGTCLRREQA